MKERKDSLSEFTYKFLGCLSYEDGLMAQENHHKLCLQEGAAGFFLALEHKPVVTLGKHASQEDLLLSQDFFSQKGVQIHRSDRGGKVTCHMPGQIVLYPILPLEKLGIGVRAYVTLLEESLLDLLGDHGVKGYLDKDNPGVWVDERKIASVGIRVKDRISYHGLALNVSNDLKLFDWVVPCGMTTCRMTRLRDHVSRVPALSELLWTLCQKIAKSLKRELVSHSGAMDPCILDQNYGRKSTELSA